MTRAKATLVGFALAAAAGFAGCGGDGGSEGIGIEPSSGKTGTRVEITNLPECDGRQEVSLEAVGSEKARAPIKNGTGNVPIHAEATRYEVVLSCANEGSTPETTRTGTFFEVEVDAACRTSESVAALPSDRDCDGLQLVAEGEKCDQTFSSDPGVSPPQTGGPWAEAKHLKCFGERWRTAAWVRATVRARVAQERRERREARENPAAPIPGTPCTPGEDLPAGYECVPGSPTFP